MQIQPLSITEFNRGGSPIQCASTPQWSPSGFGSRLVGVGNFAPPGGVLHPFPHRRSSTLPDMDIVPNTLPRALSVQELQKVGHMGGILIEGVTENANETSSVDQNEAKLVSRTGAVVSRRFVLNGPPSTGAKKCE